MTFVSDSKLLVGSNDGCSNRLSEGKLYVAPILNCDFSAPPVYTLDVQTAALINATSIDVNITGATAQTRVWLEKGRIIRFVDGATNIDVVNVNRVELVGTGPFTLTIEPAPAAIPATATAEVISALECVSLTDLPFNFSADTENSDRLASGIQGDSDITKIRASASLTGFVRDDDAAVWQKGLMFSSGTGVVTLYILADRASGKLNVFGPAQFQSFEFQNAAASLQKFTTTLQLKPDWYAPTHYDFLSVTEKAALNRVRVRFGAEPLA